MYLSRGGAVRGMLRHKPRGIYPLVLYPLRVGLVATPDGVVSQCPPSRRFERMPDEALERTAQGWIQAVTGQPFMSYGTDGFARNIKR